MNSISDLFDIIDDQPVRYGFTVIYNDSAACVI